MFQVKQLTIISLQLPPGNEWKDLCSGWLFVRVKSGDGYLIANASAKPLSTGEMLVICRPTGVEIRASRIGPLCLEVFVVTADAFLGIATLPERRLIEQSEPLLTNNVSIFPASEGLAIEYQRLCELPAEPFKMVMRARLLTLVSLFLQSVAQRQPVVVDQMPEGGAARFQKLISEMTETELSDISIADLAARCQCSERHVSRLFREHFDRSIREKQIGFRLAKAGQLLRHTNEKIINIALESGFRNLGLFNSMFKRKYGQTPSRWRIEMRKRRRPARVSSTLMVALCVLFSAFSAIQAAEKTTPATSRSFEVKNYQVEGNTLLATNQVSQVFSNAVGPHVTFEQIHEALGKLQLLYREKGFVTVAVGLPQQQLTNGIVRVQVTEGRIVAINVIGNRYTSSNNVMRSLPGLHTNMFLNNKWFQPALDVANANSDRQIYPVVGPGPDPGTSALTLKVKDRLPLHGHLEFNNRGTLNTPPFRIDTALQYNNLWQLDHQMGLQYTFVPDQAKFADQLPAFYDIPLIASYSAFYRMPLGSPASMEELFNSSPSDFGFDEVSRQFRRPPVTGQSEVIFYASRSTTDSGLRLGATNTIAITQLAEIYSIPSGRDLSITENLGSRFSYPLPEWRTIRSSFSAGLDYKSYRLASYNTNTTKFALYALQQGERVFVKEADVPLDSQSAAGVHYLPFALSWTASGKDRFGASSFSFNNTLNLRALSSSDASFQQTAGNPDTSANFYVASASLSREQTLYHAWNALLRANGQWANKPVISNEQFGIGGTGGVRGYEEGEEYGDAGWRVLLEPRTPFYNIGMMDGTMPTRIRGSLFLDYGERYLYSPGRREGSLAMCGTGFSLNTVIGQNFEGRFTLAWSLLDTPNTPAGKARAYFSVNAQF